MQVETTIPHLKLFLLLTGLFAPRQEGRCATQHTWKTSLYTSVKLHLKQRNPLQLKEKKQTSERWQAPRPTWCDFRTRKNRQYGKRKTKGTRGQFSRRRGHRKVRGMSRGRWDHQSHPAASAQHQTQGGQHQHPQPSGKHPWNTNPPRATALLT